MDPCPLIIAGASRPYPGETGNGDAWVVHQQGDVYRLTVIDGLGHGPAAAAAAEAALNCLDMVADAEPVAALRACHEALIGTRGAVMLVALVDTHARRLRFAGVGNVEARLRQGGTEQRLVSYRGIVGTVLPTIRTFDYPLLPGWLLVVYTDGIKGRFELTDETAGETVTTEWAERFLERWARPTDDATIVALTQQLI